MSADKKTAKQIKCTLMGHDWRFYNMVAPYFHKDVIDPSKEPPNNRTGAYLKKECKKCGMKMKRNVVLVNKYKRLDDWRVR